MDLSKVAVKVETPDEYFPTEPQTQLELYPRQNPQSALPIHYYPTYHQPPHVPLALPLRPGQFYPPNQVFMSPHHMVPSSIPPQHHQQLPQLSPVTAAPATDRYGSNLNYIPTEAASIGTQRPFKALTSPRSNPLSLISSLDPSTEAEYEEYKNKMLASVSALSGQSTRNRNMSRNVPINPEKINDPEYLEKRRKNNEAAKKSRDARKSKEDEMAIRVAFLEKEVYKLMFRLAMLQEEKRQKLQNRQMMAGMTLRHD